MREEVRNAMITSVDFNTERGLTIFVGLDYGGAGQSFGGYALYSPNTWEKDGSKNFCGHFVHKMFETLEVNSFAEMIKHPCRVRSSHSNVAAIGHFTKDKWFCPKEEFARFSK